MGDEVHDNNLSGVNPGEPEAPTEAPGEAVALEADALDAEQRREESRRRRAERAAAAARERERRLWLGMWIAGAFVVAAFLILMWPVMAARLGAAKQLDDAYALLGQAENSIAQVDKVVQRQLSAEAAPSVRDLKPELAVAKRELAQADALVADAMPHLTEDEQARGELIKSAIAARREMVERTPGILTASTKAVRAKTAADRGWSLTLRANAAAESAARSYRRHTASAVTTAAASIATIRGALADSRVFYSEAASAFPEAGFERYTAYVDAKSAEIGQLESAARAWLRHDLASASRLFAAYQKSAAKTSAQFKQLPGAPGVATGQAFRRLVGGAADAYAKARTKAEQADKALKTP
jgi:hypothetical protein